MPFVLVWLLAAGRRLNSQARRLRYQVQFEAGQRETVRWYLENQEWVRAVSGEKEDR